ncbi:MAG: sugar-transfer associated ATP-grasp domain-containing protein [Bacteroidota bacterium]
MKRYLQNMLKAQESIMGINRRNIEYVYPLNPRRDYKYADDKALSKSILEKHKVPVPGTFAIIEHLWEVDKALDSLENLDKFVVKPSMGSGGNGILIFEKHSTGWITPDGKIYERERIKMHIASILYGAYSHDHADKAIIEERLDPHHFFRKIYKTGIPDVRVIVHRDVPVMAMLRIPTQRSKGKANLHQGALGIGIDMETGRLGYGVYKNRRIQDHPDSGLTFKGMVIPGWESFVSISTLAATLVPLKFLGVDLIMDEHRGPLIIEINARPGLQIQNSNSMGLLRPLEKHMADKL